MNDIINELNDHFVPPFYARGCAVVDDRGYVLCTLSTCMLTKEQGKRLADKVAEMINSNHKPQ